MKRKLREGEGEKNALSKITGMTLNIKKKIYT